MKAYRRSDSATSLGEELKSWSSLWSLSWSIKLCSEMVQSVFKVSSSTSAKTKTHPGLPPPHPPCLPKSATPSACTWTTSCVPTESGTPILWRTRTSRPGRRYATTGGLSICRRTSIGLSLRPRLGRESQSQPSSCSPSLIPATSGMSESPEYMDCTYKHIQYEHAPVWTQPQRHERIHSASLRGRTGIDAR